MKPIKIIASDPDLQIEVPVGNLSSTLVGGLGGYEEIERQDDVNATDWTGQEALKQDISVLLDGFAANDSVERELNTILKLGRDPNGEREPPVFKVWGPVYFPGKAWVLGPDGIDLNGGEIETIRRRGDGELLRQEIILHLTEYNRPDTIKLRKPRTARTGVSPNVAVGGTYTVKKGGETLHEIAANIYRDWREWKKLGNANNVSDPNRKLPGGRVLKVP